MRTGWLIGTVVLAACQLDTRGQGDAAAESDPGPGSNGPTAQATESAVTPPPGSTGATGSNSGADPLTSGPATGTETSTSTGPLAPDTDSSSTGDGHQASIPMLRIELPCVEGSCPFNPDDVCRMDPTVSTQEVFDGEPGTIYEVTVRVRGVVEMSSYVGGTPDAGGNVYVGGNVDSYWSPFSLVVSEPAQTYWLNALGEGDLFTHGMDYTYTLPVAAGATVQLRGGSGDDSCGLLNLDQRDTPIVIPDIHPAPRPFNGQFVQVDAELIVAM